VGQLHDHASSASSSCAGGLSLPHSFERKFNWVVAAHLLHVYERSSLRSRVSRERRPASRMGPPMLNGSIFGDVELENEKFDLV